MIRRYFLILAIAFSCFSCERILDQIKFNKDLQNYTSSYQGIWKGEYSGRLQGNLQITVYKSGTMEVVRTFANQTEIFHGQVYENGSFLGGTSNTGFKLMGSLYVKGGTWKYETLSGNWTVTKQ